MPLDKNRTTLIDNSSSGPSSHGAGEFLLVTMRGNDVGAIHPLNLQRPLIIIGREDAAVVQIVDGEVSRRHAAIRLDKNRNRLVLVDLKSSNGTFKNGTRVDGEVDVDVGDKIGLGKSIILRVCHSSEPEALYAMQMYQAVLRDGLTGAFNRRYLDERIKKEVAFAQRHHEALALLLLDLDHFKQINDNFGHQAGDAVLRDFVGLLHTEVRTEDVVARYGGEEFAILCRDTSPQEALVLAERLRAAVDDHGFVYEGSSIPVTVSIGAANIAERDGITPDAFVEAADKALYQAKRDGRNRCRADR